MTFLTEEHCYEDGIDYECVICRHCGTSIFKIAFDGHMTRDHQQIVQHAHVRIRTENQNDRLRATNRHLNATNRHLNATNRQLNAQIRQLSNQPPPPPIHHQFGGIAAQPLIGHHQQLAPMAHGNAFPRPPIFERQQSVHPPPNATSNSSIQQPFWCQQNVHPPPNATSNSPIQQPFWGQQHVRPPPNSDSNSSIQQPFWGQQHVRPPPNAASNSSIQHQQFGGFAAQPMIDHRQQLAPMAHGNAFPRPPIFECQQHVHPPPNAASNSSIQQPFGRQQHVHPPPNADSNSSIPQPFGRQQHVHPPPNAASNSSIPQLFNSSIDQFLATYLQSPTQYGEFFDEQTEGGGTSKTGGNGMRPVNWACQRCGYVNFSFRYKCNRCGVPKGENSKKGGGNGGCGPSGKGGGASFGGGGNGPMCGGYGNVHNAGRRYNPY